MQVDRGPVHRREPRCSATTSRRSLTTRPRSEPRRAPSPASPPSRSTSPTTRSSLRATPPNVLVAMNPAALKANVNDLPNGRHPRDQLGLLRRAGSRQGRLRVQPPQRRQPVGLSGLRDTDDLADPRGVQADGGQATATPNGARTSSLSACCRGSTTGPLPIPSSGSSAATAESPIVAEANKLAFRAGYNFGETAEIFESSYEIAPAEHLPGTYTNVTGNVALAWGLLAAAISPSCLCSSALIRSRPRRTSCTSSPSTRISAYGPSRPKTRSPASAPPSVRLSGGHSG